MIDPQVFPFVIAKLHRLEGTAYGAGFTYTAGQPCTNPPFLRERRMCFPFVTAKLHRLGVLRFEEGTPIPTR